MNPIKLVVIFIFSLGLMACGSSSEKLVVTPPASALTMAFTADKTFHFTWPAATSAMYYELYEATTVGAGFTLIKSTALLEFDHVVPLYARLNAKYMLKSCSASACSSSTAIFTSTKLAAMTSSIGLKRATTPVADENFGWDVSLSSDGSTLAVASQQADAFVGKPKSGVVTVYTRSDESWVYQANLVAPNSGANDEFGSRISLSDDGNVLAISATGEDGDDNSLDNSGAVYVFTRDAQSAWSGSSDVATLRAGTDSTDNVADLYFGASLSLSGDGTTLAVGTRQTADNGEDGLMTDDGGVFVFHSDNNNVWTHQDSQNGSEPLKSALILAADYFGWDVSLSNDGNTLAVGAPMADTPAPAAVTTGAAYIFTREGAIWTEQKTLEASNKGAGDGFGFSVSLSGDGASLVVGAIEEDGDATSTADTPNNSALNSGAVYFFTGSGANWTQKAYLKASNTGAEDQFGATVSLNTDGTILAVGAVGEDSDSKVIDDVGTDVVGFNSGAVYVFKGLGATWTQQAYLKASNTGANDEFGGSLSLSSDGTVLAVGVPQERGAENGTINSGAVYLY